MLCFFFLVLFYIISKLPNIYLICLKLLKLFLLNLLLLQYIEEVLEAKTEPTNNQEKAKGSRNDVSIQVKPTVVSKGISNTTFTKEKTTQSKRITVKNKAVSVRPSVTKESTTMTEVNLKNIGTQTTNEYHNNSAIMTDAATMADTFQHLPEIAENENEVLESSILSSEYDDPNDKSFSVEDECPAATESKYETDDENDIINLSTKFIVFWPMLSQLLVFCLKCKKAPHIEMLYQRAVFW